MHKVIVINLNGHAYQVDEIGHDALRAYLDRAEAQLRGNPDLAEIMADLEQAIGEKCQRFLNPHKTVVSAAEVEQILAEMGPVDAAPGETAPALAIRPRVQRKPTPDRRDPEAIPARPGACIEFARAR
jgi:hypothetical protein